MKATEPALVLVEATHAFFALWKSWLRSRLPPGETNPTRLLVLVSLERMGPVSMGTLSGRLLIPRPSLTALVDELEADGWVTRQADAGDRRVSRLHLWPGAASRAGCASATTPRSRSSSGRSTCRRSARCSPRWRR